MTSNIQRIRAAESVIPQLQAELKRLREEALADDGQVDAEEQVDIDRVAGKLSTVMEGVAAALQAWTSNKTAYDKMRAGFAQRLKDAAACPIEDLQQDKRAIEDTVAAIDEIAGTEDYAAALDLCKTLDRLLLSFEREVDNERLADMTPEQLAAENLTEGDLDDLFTEDYMLELAEMDFPGEGTPELADLMAEIEKGVTGPRRTEVMADLCRVVGDPPSAAELDADYGRFLIVRKQQEAIGAQNDQGEMEGLDEEKHPDFRGSRSQLMFGKVLGDAFGIHEVFAALLSPTGGLVGPGNDLLPGCIESPHLSPDNPVALHGTVHDAAGYLKSFHNKGPGYNYRDDYFEGLATEAIECLPADFQSFMLPLTGQASGIYFWTMEVGEDFAREKVDEIGVAIEQELTQARDRAAVEAARLIGEIEQARDDAIDDAEALRQEAENRIRQAERDLRDLAAEAEAEAMEVRDAAREALESAANSAVETYEEASADLRGLEQDARDTLDALSDFIWS